MGNTYIYGLRDPRDWRIRYIGRTAVKFYTRLIGHLHARHHTKHTRRERWIQYLLKLGLKPKIEFLECVPGNGFEAEQKWIAKFREMGHDLVNGDDGGAGVVVGGTQSKKKVCPLHVRKLLSDLWKPKGFNLGLQRSAELRRGKKESPEHIRVRTEAIKRGFAACGWVMQPRLCLLCKNEFKPRKQKGIFCSQVCANRFNGRERCLQVH